MTLYLIRHLPTSWNKKKVLQGSNDISIEAPSFEVKSQIEVNLQKLDYPNKNYLVLCSKLKRTQETAQEYQIKKYKIEPLLNELDFGVWEGKKKSVMLEAVGKDWLNNPLNLKFGEPLKSFQDRLLKFTEKYQSFPNIICFAHGAVIRALLSIHKYGHINKMNQFEVENNQLIRISFN